MGPSNSKQASLDNTEILKINHPRFQNIKLSRNHQDQDCIEVNIPVPNIEKYKQWATKLKQAGPLSETFLMPDQHSFQKEGFCGSSGYVNAVFQNFPYVLTDEIRNRASLKQKLFQEPELWFLIYTLISSGNQFHKKNKKIGDVRPENIFINEDGQVKVANSLTWPSEYSNFYKTFYEKQTTYLAPEELKDIQSAKMESSCNLALAQSFSIGLTCLDAGTLTTSDNLYLKNNKFDYAGLSKKLQELQSLGYSQILFLVVSNLCEPDSDRRSACTQLFKWLQPHQDDIINLRPFDIHNFPERFVQLGLVGHKPHNFIQGRNQDEPKQYVKEELKLNHHPTYIPQNIAIQQNFAQNQTFKIQQSLNQHYTVQPQPKPQHQSQFQPQTQQNGNLNLNRIDQQLQQSRKMFPS